MKTKIKLITTALALSIITNTSHALPATYAKKSNKRVPIIKKSSSLPIHTPWNLKKLSKPPKYKWTEGTEVKSLLYTGEKYKGKPTSVFAYYATPGTLAGDPSKDKNLPAIVLVHGGGGKAFEPWAKLWASRGYAAIAMDLSGHGFKKRRLPDGGPRQRDKDKFATGIDTKDTWTYHAVANVILAHSLISSFPEVDSKNTALTGISWGGYLTCIVAGLDNRFKAAAPIYGCGFLHENSYWTKAIANLPAKENKKWIKFWDPSTYVGSATMPMLFANGGTDFAYPPDSFAKTYNLVRSTKNLHFVPDFRHGHFFDKPKSLEIFINHHLKAGTNLADIEKITQKNGKLTASVKTTTELTAAALHYSTENLKGDSRKRKWITIDGTIKNNTITTDLPPKNATVYFLTTTDNRQTTVTSDLVFPSK